MLGQVQIDLANVHYVRSLSMSSELLLSVIVYGNRIVIETLPEFGLDDRETSQVPGTLLVRQSDEFRGF